MKIAQPSVDLFVGGVLHVLKPNEDPTEGTITSIKFTEHTMLVTLAEDIGEPGMPDFTQHEIDEGFEMRWADSLDQAAILIDANTSSDDLDVRFMSLRDAAILRSAK